MKEQTRMDNKSIEAAITEAKETHERETFFALMAAIKKEMNAGGCFYVMMGASEDSKEGRQVVVYSDESKYLAIYTNDSEFEDCPDYEPVLLSIGEAIEQAVELDEIDGIVINPDGESYRLSKYDLWALLKNREEQNSFEHYNTMISKAMYFAADYYDGVFWKGTGIPYMTHAIDVCATLHSMGANTNVLIAGLLHDVVNQGGSSTGQVGWYFGLDVEEMVHFMTFEEGTTWEEQKERFLERLKNADKNEKLLAMAHQVATLRSIQREWKATHKVVWERYGASREDLSAYFGDVEDELEEFQFDDFTKDVYWEMVSLRKDFFVDFYYDQSEQRTFQICADGFAYSFAKNDLEGKPWHDELPNTAIPVSRRYAERIEDNWSELYDCQHSADGYSFENYFAAVKDHMRDYFKRMSEGDIDSLMISNIRYIRARYEGDTESMLKGHLDKGAYLSTGPAQTALYLERMVRSIV